MDMNQFEALRQVPLLAALTDEQIAVVADRFRADSFASDTIVFLEGDPADRLWVVQAGQIKIVKHSSDGQENLLEVIMPGEVFGGAAILFPAHPATAIAMTDTTTLSLERSEFLSLLRRCPEVALRIIDTLGERLRAAMKMRALAPERVEVRLANILLKLGSKVGSPVVTGGSAADGLRIEISLSRQDLADMAGTTIETAIRMMSRFRKEGLVHTEPGGFIVITDRERLQRLSEGESI
jgi:CRP/FNR family transcriptional regulator